jgi:hypothetical protein
MQVDLFLAGCFLVGFFLLVRKFWWWYFGIERMIDALEDIAESLRTLPSVREYDARARRRPPRAA